MGWSGGNFHDYDREYGGDLVQLAAFLRGTQPEAPEALALPEDGPTRRAFLTRLCQSVGAQAAGVELALSNPPGCEIGSIFVFTIQSVSMFSGSADSSSCDRALVVISLLF